MCRPATPTAGLPGPLTAAAWLLYAAGWTVLQGARLVVRAAPLGLAAAVIGYRWCTGLPMRPAYAGRHWVTRRTRAAGQLAATAAAVALAVWPVPAAVVLAVVLVGLAAAIAGTRARARALTRPRRVRATAGRPLSRPVPALPAVPVRPSTLHPTGRVRAAQRVGGAR